MTATELVVGISLACALGGCDFGKGDISVNAPPSERDASMSSTDRRNGAGEGSITPPPALHDAQVSPSDSTPAQPDQHPSKRDGAVACENGAIECAQVTLLTISDRDTPLAGVSLTIATDGHIFSGRTDDQSSLVISLPLATPIWVHAVADDHFGADQPLWVESSSTEHIYLLRQDNGALWLKDAGVTIDPNKTLVVMRNPDKTTGSGLTLDEPHDGPFGMLEQNREPVLDSDVLVEGSDGTLTFANVPIGPITPTIISPPSHDCRGPFEGGFATTRFRFLTIPITCRALD